MVTLSGSDMIVEKGKPFVDPGAIWVDDVDGSGSILSASSGSVDTNIPGTYTLTYTYIDKAGNIGNSVTRTVTVDLGNIPVITLSGATNITMTV